MITGTQVKAARKLLGWSVTILAKRSGQSAHAIAVFEDGIDPTKTPDNVVKRLRGALEDAGVEFLFDDPATPVRFRLGV